MKLWDTLVLAINTVRSHRLRTGITVAIIAFGIMALVGIITAIEAMNASLRESFSTMGANAFSMRFKERRMQFGRGEVKKTDKRTKKAKKSNEGKIITFEQAKMFKQRYEYPGAVSVGLSGPRNQTVFFENNKTNPTVTVNGGDENYLLLNGYEVEYGRALSKLDVESGRNIAVIGSDVAKKLFGDRPEQAVDKVIRVGSNKYRVVGVTKEKGASAFLQLDNVVFTSYNNIRRLFSNPNQSFSLAVMVDDVRDMDQAIGEAEGTFRPIRGLATTEENNFYVDKSDSIAETFIKLLGTISAAAGAIGFITLLGAAIGLMNIMLVAVSERTREVGLIKALGGTKGNIRRQFLYESIIISLMGAVIGIVLGVAVGNGVGALLDTGFLIPWKIMGAGILICSMVGLFAGLYPAWKASSLDPIVALRYE
ncbi:MAG TPA: ABC transporter permease [Chitinophagaceae bacterium]|nr:ABC transporter permease [Chitinophagaceae bacterium]